MTEPIDIAFEKYTETKLMKNDRVHIYCKRWLWGVEAPDLDTAKKEAMRYFIQYYEDGEYE